ncbi:hypothetical protein, partial [Enterobacter hormaechei]|uniref:hypothetical protein n=1 Tax=Enterobacter hormaechei TaxID=158836 RepID=UPI002874CE2A
PIFNWQHLFNQVVVYTNPAIGQLNIGVRTCESGKKSLRHTSSQSRGPGEERDSLLAPFTLATSG